MENIIIMETALYEFKDILRNKIIDGLRIFTFISFIGIIIFGVPDNNKLIFTAICILMITALILPRKMRVLIYNDAIQFKYKSLHWYRNKDYAILFEKISRIEIEESKIQPLINLFPGFTKVCHESFSFYLKDKKTIFQKISLRQTDFILLKKVFDKKIIDVNNN